MQNQKKKQRHNQQTGRGPAVHTVPTSEVEKFKAEVEKVDLDRQQIQFNLLVEDFKARRQEVLSLHNENNRWTTLYVTALLLIIGWLINNNGQHGGGLAELYAKADNAYLILTIAVLSSLYAFSMAFKGYQIQQIALYEYDVITRQIRTLAKDFNQWERYRRINFETWYGRDPIQLGYFLLVKSLPLIVSYVIILMYWLLQWRAQAAVDHWTSLRNWFSIVAFVLVTCAIVFSVLTLRLRRTWTHILESETDGIEKAT